MGHCWRLTWKGEWGLDGEVLYNHPKVLGLTSKQREPLDDCSKARDKAGFKFYKNLLEDYM